MASETVRSRNGNGKPNLISGNALVAELGRVPEELISQMQVSPTRLRSDKLEPIVKLLLEELGGDVDSQHFRDTPARVARFYREFTRGLSARPQDILKTFRSPAHELVVVSGIDFLSLCPHHLLVYGGKLHFGYMPNGRIVGVSKIPRLVQALAVRPVVQEELVSRIADAFMSVVKPSGCIHTQKVAHVGTVDANGWPYVVPLIYIYEQGDRLYLHTGDHQGHFLTNIQQNPTICVEVGEIGAVHRGKPYACNSALVYSSVIVFGAVRIIDDRALKTWFFDRIMAKYGEDGWTFEPGYPQLNRIILYEQKMEIVTGKHSAGLYH